MRDSREPKVYNEGFHRLLTMDLEDRVEQDRGLDEVPLKLTEERIRTEWEHGASVRHYDRVPLPLEDSVSLPLEPPAPAAARHDDAAAAAAPMAAELARGPVRIENPRAVDALHRDLQKRPPAGSILHLNEAAANPVGRAAETRKLVRKAGRSRGLWTAIVVLILTLAGLVGYGYLAFQRNSVNVSALPGAATVRTVRTEAASAGDQARPAVSAAVQRVEQATAAVRVRYEQWRARH
ncbi:MAG TPA: hypothetical protein VGZ29_14360 [Terriglobia bacterium]|nr:hypothetical protein [Terriglobia bacterium]